MIISTDKENKEKKDKKNISKVETFSKEGFGGGGEVTNLERDEEMIL